jgi:hypothetical protein
MKYGRVKLLLINTQQVLTLSTWSKLWGISAGAVRGEYLGDGIGWRLRSVKFAGYKNRIPEALFPYPAGLVIATKGGWNRPGPNQWTHDATLNADMRLTGESRSLLGVVNR